MEMYELFAHHLLYRRARDDLHARDVGYLGVPLRFPVPDAAPPIDQLYEPVADGDRRGREQETRPRVPEPERRNQIDVFHQLPRELLELDDRVDADDPFSACERASYRLFKGVREPRQVRLIDGEAAGEFVSAKFDQEG